MVPSALRVNTPDGSWCNDGAVPVAQMSEGQTLAAQVHALVHLDGAIASLLWEALGNRGKRARPRTPDMT